MGGDFLRTAFAILAGWALAGSSLGFAADPAAPSGWPSALPELTQREELSPATRLLLQRLANADPAVRDAASKELAEKGSDGFPGLADGAAQTDSPEAQARLGGVLRAFHVPSNAPSAVQEVGKAYNRGRREIMEQAESGGKNVALSSYQQVLSEQIQSHGDEGQLFLRFALKTESLPVMVTMLQNVEALQAGQRARMAILSGDWGLAESDLAGSAALSRGAAMDYAALLAMRRGVAFDPVKELVPLAYSFPTPDAHHELAAALWRAKGNVFGAADEALAVNDVQSLVSREMPMRAGRYADLAAFSDTKAERRVFDSVLAAMLAGDQERADRDLPGVLKSAQTGQWDYFGVDAYLIAGHVDKAIAEAQHNGHPDTAFYLLCRQLRIREALAAVGDPGTLNPDAVSPLIDLGFDSAAKTLLGKVRPGWSLADGLVPVREQAMAIELARVGEKQTAADWRKKAFDALDRLDQKGESAAGTGAELRGRVIDPPPLLPPMRFDPADLGKGGQDEAGVWFNDVLTKEKLSAAGRYGLAVRTMNGSLTDAEADRLAEDIAEATEWAGGTRRDGLVPMIDGVKEFHRMGRDAWGEKAVKLWADRNSETYGYAILGDLALEENHAAAAAEDYQRAAPLDQTDASLMYRLGIARSRQPPTHTKGELLMAFAPNLVLGDPYQAQNLENAIAQFSGEATADTFRHEYEGRFGYWLDDTARKVLARDRDEALAHGNEIEALADQKQLLFYESAANDLVNGYPMMEGLADLYRLKARAAAAAGQTRDLKAALLSLFDYAPPDVDLLEKTIPVLKADNELWAKQVMSIAEGRLAAVVADYPGVKRYGEELGRVRALEK